MIFLDTNVISEPTRVRAEPSVVKWIADHDGQSALSTVVLGEIAAGIERIKPDLRAKRLTEFLETTRHQYTGRTYPFDVESAMIYGEIMGQAHRNGRIMKAPDAMIAAITLRHGGTLATRNVVDFEFLKMKVVNPWG